MVKKIFSILAIGAVAFAVSCSQVEEDFSTVKNGDEVTVSFSAALPEIATRASYSEGKTATKLTWAVYPSGQKTALVNKDVTIENLTAEVSTALVVGKTYDILFWAADANNQAYDLKLEDQSMTVDYSKLNANNESNDAFFAFIQGLKVTGQINQAVSLTRPFAQINLGTDDYAAAKSHNLVVGKTGMKAVLPNVLNLADGTVSGEKEVTIQGGDVPVVYSEDGTISSEYTFPVNSDTYKYLEMNYVLTGAGKAVLDCVFHVYEKDTDKLVEPAITVASVPVQRNYRTNIYGSLLTDQATFEMTITPAYVDEDADKKPDDFDVPVVEVLTVDDIRDAIAGGAEYVKVQEAPVVDKEVALPAVLAVDAGKEVVISLPETENTITFKYEEAEPADDKANLANVNIATASVESIKINLPESHVTFNGTVVNAEVSTSQTTLVVESGAEIENLTVAAGNVTIMKGGKVGSVVKDEGNKENTVLRVYEEDKPAKVDDKIKVILLGQIVIGNTSYETLSDAVAAAADGDVIMLAKGTYFPVGSAQGKELTLKGSGKDVIFKVNGTSTAFGSKVTFENITIETRGDQPYQNYNGLTGAPIIFNDCAFKNIYFGYTDLEFNNCTFDANGQEHCVWTYGSENLTFNNCEFQYIDRCVNVYVDNGDLVSIPERQVSFKGCVFKYQEGVKDSKGAVEINSKPFTNGVNVIFEGCTKPASGEMVYISEWDSENGKNATVTIDGEVVHCPPVELNGAYYPSIEAALANAVPGDVINLAKGEHELPAEISLKDSATGSLTFAGIGEETVLNGKKRDGYYPGVYATGLNIKMENLVYNTCNSHAYDGGIFATSFSLENCIINGLHTLYGTTTYEKCTFNITGDSYSVRTGGQNAEFTNCVFNCDGKSVLIYSDETPVDNNYTFNECTFNDSDGLVDETKAAIEIGADNDNTKYTININKCTVNGFSETKVKTNENELRGGTDSGTNVWGNKNMMTAEKLNVFIDGKEVY